MERTGRTLILILVIILCVSVLSINADGGGNQGYKITGSGMNYPEAPSWATLGVNIDSLNLRDGWLRYYYPDTGLKLISTSIIEVVVEGESVTITGTGTVHGNEGFTFRATINDANPDAFGIEIQSPEGSPYFSVEVKPIVRGDFVVSVR